MVGAAESSVPLDVERDHQRSLAAVILIEGVRRAADPRLSWAELRCQAKRPGNRNRPRDARRIQADAGYFARDGHEIASHPERDGILFMERQQRAPRIQRVVLLLE
jgi:hypothetical protein